MSASCTIFTLPLTELQRYWEENRLSRKKALIKRNVFKLDLKPRLLLLNRMSIIFCLEMHVSFPMLYVTINR